MAAERPFTTMSTLTQTGRYSVMAAQPTAGQRDLLSVTRAITIPGDIDSVGEAFHWMLRDSGYRLAADAVLSEEAKAMLALPLPAVHRRFEPMPLQTVMGLVIGPAFHLIQDPVHRLIAFERCSEFSAPNATGGAQ
ncbi:MAG: pili assembly chaperone [Pusillimonas sp.]|nr:pili assembly chaperone [Pusillimonas sp.]